MNNSEAIFAFIAFLSSRQEKTVLSTQDNTVPVMELADHFIAAQGFEPAQSDWANEYKPMNEKPITTRKPISQLSQQDAENCIFAHIGGKPKGFRVTKFEGLEIWFFYINAENKKELIKIKIQNLGFKAFNYLQSVGYDLK